MNLTPKKAGELLSENMRTLYLWSLHKVSDAHKAEDLCSEIMLAVMQSAPNLKNDDAFFGFVWGIAANTYKNYLRRQSKNQHSPIDEDMPHSDNVLDSLCDEAQLNSLRREIAFLSLKYRLCTIAYYYDNLSIKEIAEKYGFTSQTVKFNLFQSRKILKEGIAMERQFGEKSFKPSPFIFQTIVDGGGNADFINLFRRLLPGQILLSAYNEPLTIEQLSFELGVASVYIEDEVRVLLEYGFMKKHGERKFQTNILIFTKGYIDAIFDRLDRKYPAKVKEIIGSMRKKLPDVRSIGFNGCGLPDNLLLWDLYAWFCIKAISAASGNVVYKPLYGDTTGICYALGYTIDDFKYPYRNFSGRFQYAEHCKGSKINFEGHRIHDMGQFGFLNDEKNYSGDYFPVFSKDEEDKVLAVLSNELESTMKLLADIAELSVDTLKEHSPETAYELIDACCPHIAIWDLVGWLGATAENTGALERPAEDEYAGIVGYK